MCEVAVCKGDVGGHARACSRVSRGECERNGVQSGRRNTQVCVGRMETMTATVEGQKPSSGGSCNGDHAGLYGSVRMVRAVQRTRPHVLGCESEARSGNARGGCS